MSAKSSTATSIAFLLAASLSAAGHDVTNPTLGPTPYSITDPRVATNGDTFLTLWTTTIGTGDPFIYGSVADAHGHAITSSFRLLPSSADLVDLIALGSGYLVLWQDAREGLHSAVISGSGVVIGPGPAAPKNRSRPPA